jgi:DNA-binding NarL/FixJ family response regulator
MLAGERSMVRDGVSSLLSTIEDFDVVAPTEGEAETLATLESLRPDVLVIDVGLDTGAAGGPSLELAATARRQGTRVVMLADRVDAPALLDAVRRGVSGYLLKADGTESLVAAARAAAAGEAWLCPAAARYLLELYRELEAPVARPGGQSGRADVLTERELAVVRLVAHGRSNAEIATELMLARSTVKTHVSRILAKLELRDRVQLAAFAHQNDVA